MHKKAKKLGLDLNQYNMLKQESARIQYHLKKLRNPLKLKLPPTAVQNATIADILAENKPASKEAPKPSNDSEKEKTKKL